MLWPENGVKHPTSPCVLVRLAAVIERGVVIATGRFPHIGEIRIQGLHAGIGTLDEAGKDPVLRYYHLFDATPSEFHPRAGDVTRARHDLEAARRKTHSPFDLEIIDRRLSMDKENDVFS